MACIADRNFAILRCASADEGGVLPRQRTLTEQAACSFGKLVHPKSERNKTPEDSVKLRHQHRSGHPLAGHIAESEIKIRLSGLNDVNVVPADQTGGLITIVKMPPFEAEVVAGQ